MRPQFLARLVPALGTAVLVALFIHLGLWQAGKAERQRTAQAQYEARQRADPLELTDASLDPQDARLRRAIVRGHFDAAHQVLLDNQVQDERAGFHVITPLRISGSGDVVMVNRGWIPAPMDRRIVPAAPLPVGAQVVTGELVAPPKPRWLSSSGAAHAADGGWPAIWQALDLNALEARTGYRVAPLILRLSPDAAGGFVRRWPAFDGRAAMHQGYAYQWFGLAALVAGIFLISCLRMVLRSHFGKTLINKANW